MEVELSGAEKDFLAKCEEEFKDRYTEKDEDYMKVFNKVQSIPPIVENFNNYERRNDRHNRRFMPFAHQGHRDNQQGGYRGHRGNNDYNNYNYKHSRY